MRNVLLMLAGATVASCATNAGGYRTEEQLVERLRRMDKAEVALKLGAPDSRVAIDEQHESWTYESALVSVIGGQCKISIAFSGDRVEDAVVNSFDYSPLAYPMGSCSQIVRALD